MADTAFEYSFRYDSYECIDGRYACQSNIYMYSTCTELVRIYE